MYIEGHNHCFKHYFGVKILSETLFSPPLMKPGCGAKKKGLRGEVQRQTRWMEAREELGAGLGRPATDQELADRLAKPRNPATMF